MGLDNDLNEEDFQFSGGTYFSIDPIDLDGGSLKSKIDTGLEELNRGLSPDQKLRSIRGINEKYEIVQLYCQDSLIAEFIYVQPKPLLYFIFRIYDMATSIIRHRLPQQIDAAIYNNSVYQLEVKVSNTYNGPDLQSLLFPEIKPMLQVRAEIFQPTLEKE